MNVRAMFNATFNVCKAEIFGFGAKYRLTVKIEVYFLVYFVSMNFISLTNLYIGLIYIYIQIHNIYILLT